SQPTRTTQPPKEQAQPQRPLRRPFTSKPRSHQSRNPTKAKARREVATRGTTLTPTTQGAACTTATATS
ncbi:hypothetical protein PTTG_11614, partial [Puccinia triticina 1-1 BBBD Race 1]|uniref:Uncharacterized protein n=1 Tax=Puccinia triticina (isolate 1-1 / race 1 (BBBD)) TaxID=630390 RepID=A0A0C4FEF8_PUCT1